MKVKIMADQVTVNAACLVDIRFADEDQDVKFNLVTPQGFNAFHYSSVRWFGVGVLAMSIMEFRRPIQAAAY